ncbi:hypothetical protein ABK040_003426 [Willaertia magna]
MGCFQSKKDKKVATREKGEERSLLYTWSFQSQKTKGKKEVDTSTLNPQDFMVGNLSDQTIVRKPGQLLGQSFNLDKCTNCDVYLLDVTSQIFIDGCENCRFFIAPCSGSIFIRTSKNCKFIVACQQLRTRDCSDVELSLFCGTKPVIESSTNIVFSAFASNYVGLLSQFHESDLSIYNNRWNEVHDFTPHNKNFEYSRKKVKVSDWMKPIHKVAPEVVSSSEEEERNEASVAIPFTKTKEDKPSNVILFLPGRFNEADQFFPAMVNDILHTKEHRYSKQEVDFLFEKTEQSAHLKQEALKGPFIAIGTNLNSIELRTKASQLVPPESFYVPNNEKEAYHIANYIFNVHKVEGN